LHSRFAASVALSFAKQKRSNGGLFRFHKKLKWDAATPYSVINLLQKATSFSVEIAA
jgi:hypothetical protein